MMLSSCSKELLETLPNDRLSEDIYWKTENDAKLAVNSLYTFLDGVSALSWDAATEIAHSNQLANSLTFVELGTYDIANAKVLAEWSAGFNGIRAANYFLENVDKVTGANPDNIARFKAEARVLRAYQYIKLAGFFGDVPLLTATVSLEEAGKLTRTPVEQIWDFVDTELAAAAQVLPPSYPAADRGRITSGAAWALKARADLWAGRYQLAIDAAEMVQGYSLYPSYADLFKYVAENNVEVVLDKQFIKNNYQNNVFAVLSPFSQLNGASMYVPTRAMVDAYETADGKKITDPGSGYDPLQPYNNRDPRLRFSIYVDGDILPSGIVFEPAPNSGGPDAIGATFVNSTTGFNIRKYINPEDYATPSNSGINIILLRYAEVLLTLAEAKIELNQLDASVYDAINTVRNGRTDVKMPSIGNELTQEELREIVRQERTVELAFEGLHLFDIRRWKTAELVMPGPVLGMDYLDNGELKTVVVAGVNRSFDKRRHYLWPIPLTEINLNGNLSQNPDW